MNVARLLVSACLAGIPCRYDGKSQPIQAIVDAVRRGEMIPICPEVEGGLSTPRIPCERRGNRVINRVGEDKTEAFMKGAQRAWERYQQEGCCAALLQSRSPSCGVTHRYDGTFQNRLIVGQGITAELLQQQGVPLFEDTQWEAAMEYGAAKIKEGGDSL
jgi:uncharacterized protein YbbK (DUF523 family)